MKNVIFLAPPAGGKGTMSDFLVSKYHYQHLATGNILRDAAQEDEDLARLMASGALVDDETMIKLLKETLQKITNNKPFILDGFPRTLYQAQELDIILSGLNKDNYVVVYIDVDEETLQKRVLGRLICPKCHKTYNCLIDEFKPELDNVCDVCESKLIHRDDDTAETLAKRYQNYIKSTKPLIKYYEDKGRLKVISNKAVDQTLALRELVGVLSD